MMDNATTQSESNSIVRFASSVSLKNTEEKLSYYTIENKFYNGMRNTTTNITYDQIKKLALELQEPLYFGRFHNNKHYYETLCLILKTTHETRHMGFFLLKCIIPTLNYKNTLLDVGPGNGILTRWIASKFKKTTVIDINKNVLDDLNNNFKVIKRGATLNKVHNSILDVELIPNYYDFCLVSHMLYYIKIDKWLDVVTKTFQSIKKGGLLVIALSGDSLGKANLINHFHGTLIDIDEFILRCAYQLKTSRIKVCLSKEEFHTKDLNSMMHVAGFLLHDGNATAEEESLRAYLLDKHRNIDGSFSITSMQKFIVIYKL